VVFASAIAKNDENKISGKSLIDHITSATTPRGLCPLLAQRYALGMPEDVARIKGGFDLL
jgi:hypothetical protein